MAGESDTTLPPLEGLGGNVFNGRSGYTNKLGALAGTGAVYQHSTAGLTLPMLTMFVVVGKGLSANGALVLPQLVADGAGGSRAVLTLPALTVAATGDVPFVFSSDTTLPALTLAADGQTGTAFPFALRLPMLTVDMRTGSHAALALPQLVAAGSVTTAEAATYAGHLPLLRTTGTISVFSYPSSAVLTLPMIVPGPYGSAALGLPLVQTYGTFVLPAAFEAWVMNVRNGGVTRFTNFPFKQFTRVGSQTFAVGDDGAIYLLGGDLDNTAPIQWQFETGLEDLGSPGLKHVPYLYMDAIIDGVLQISLIDDRDRVFAYEYDSQGRPPVHQPHRRKLGNGIRTRSVAFRFESSTGAYIEVDSLEPEATVTQRNL
jgi:hypothetical protein